MSIDRIGQRPGATPAPDQTSTTEGTKDFRVDAPRPPSPGAETVTGTPPGTASGATTSGASAGMAAAVGLSPADRVRQGQLSLDEYLDLRVHEATGHLEGKLGPGDLARVQQTLRTQLAQDPWLHDLMTRATGHSAPVDDA